MPGILIAGRLELTQLGLGAKGLAAAAVVAVRRNGPTIRLMSSELPERSLKSLVDEFRHLRLAGINFFDSLSDEILDRTGLASDCRFTVRSIPYIIAGHELHHVRVVEERYAIR